MARPLVDDELWQRIQQVLPPPKPRRPRYPGRKPIDDRRALTGILFVFKMGIPWEELPHEMGSGSGMTCWRRLQQWLRTGAWEQMQPILQAALAEADKIDWSRAAREAANRPAPVGEPSGILTNGIVPTPSHQSEAVVPSGNGPASELPGEVQTQSHP